MIKKFFYTSHRILGVVTCLLFLMWFITGLVLIYHSFPDVDKSLRNSNADNLVSATLPNLQEMELPNQLKSLSIGQLGDETILTYKDKKEHRIATSSMQPIKGINLEDVKRIASSWVDAPILKIDTLDKRDIWIMYDKYVKELPIYKVHFDDKEQHQLYISSRTGEVQQFTTKSERVWAYLGSIPHKLYIPALRQHTAIWIGVLTTLATLCFIACITGLVLGIRAYIARYKRTGKFSSPYKKPWYKWHNVLGLIFGIFLLFWAISGMMALRKTPQWLVKTHQNYPYSKVMQGKAIILTDFKLDYRDIVAKYPDTKNIRWKYFYNAPYYEATIGGELVSIDASTPHSVELFNIKEIDLVNAIKEIHGNSVAFDIKIIDKYEEYYLPWKRELPLPAYKVSVNSTDKNIYYIATDGNKITHLDNNRKARKWLFKAPHYLHFQFLMERPVLWTITIWVLALGCSAICLSGVILSCKYIGRKTNKRKKKCD